MSPHSTTSARRRDSKGRFKGSENEENSQDPEINVSNTTNRVEGSKKDAQHTAGSISNTDDDPGTNNTRKNIRKSCPYASIETFVNPDTTPIPFLTRAANTQLKLIQELFIKQLNKTAAIGKLESHVVSGTAPRSIQIRVKIHVHHGQQSDVDEKLDAAKKKFHDEATKILLEARKSELSSIKKEIEDARIEWSDKRSFFVALRHRHTSEDPELPDSNAMEQAETEFNKRYSTLIRELTDRHLSDQLTKDELAENARRKRAEAQVENTLTDMPAHSQNAKLFQKITALENQVRMLEGKGRGRSVPQKTGNPESERVTTATKQGNKSRKPASKDAQQPVSPSRKKRRNNNRRNHRTKNSNENNNARENNGTNDNVVNRGAAKENQD